MKQPDVHLSDLERVLVEALVSAVLSELRDEPELQQHYDDAARQQMTTLLTDHPEVDGDAAEEIVASMRASAAANIDEAIENVRLAVEQYRREREVREQVRRVLEDVQQMEGIVERIVALLCQPADRA